jgi:hypothetical protein
MQIFHSTQLNRTGAAASIEGPARCSKNAVGPLPSVAAQRLEIEPRPQGAV